MKLSHKIKLCISLLVVVISASYLLISDRTIEREIEYVDSKYVGETTFFDREPNGSGRMEYSNGDIYEGVWLDGYRSGYGEYIFSDGSTYIGEWLNDNFNGEGVYFDTDGFKLEGNFIEDEFESGLMTDYYTTTNGEPLFFTKKVSNYESKIINEEKVNKYDDLLSVFSSKIASGELNFIIVMDDYYNEFLRIYDDEDDYYNLLDEIDNQMFENYGVLYNVSMFGFDYFESDNSVLVNVELREVLTENELTLLNEKVVEIVDTIISTDMTTFNQIKTVHDYLISNITYNEEAEYSNNAYGAIIEGEAVCEGYTEAFSLILNELEIDNYMVPGDDNDLADDVTHIWNYVKFDEGYYHVDVTWNDPDYKDRIEYYYFGLSDDEIQEDHVIFRKNLPKSGLVSNLFFNNYSHTGLSTNLYYSNATYYGQVNSDGFEHGYGTMWWYDGDKYEGNWINGEMKGQGTYTWSDGYTVSQVW